MNSINNLNYAVLLTPDKDGGYVVTCRDLPEVITQWETYTLNGQVFGFYAG